MPQTFETQIGGRTLTIETGRLAGLAGGAVTVRYGDTMVLGTANRSDPRPGLDFFPLTVEFEERMYAAGKIPGGFINPDLLRQSAEAREFVRAFAASGKPMATLCHGPWVLASAGLTSVRRAAETPFNLVLEARP